MDSDPEGLEDEWQLLNLRLFTASPSNNIPHYVNISELRRLLCLPSASSQQNILRQNNADFGINIPDTDHGAANSIDDNSSNNSL
jgi:hypothetical protein